MLYPRDARQAIAKAFYDKPIELLRATQQVDEEGGLLPPTLNPTASLLGNINPSSELAIEEFGQNTTATAIITISSENGAKIKLADILRANGVVYQVVEYHPYDSHTTLGVKQWRTQ